MARSGKWVAVDLSPYDIDGNLGTVPEFALRVENGLLVMERDEALLVLNPLSDSRAYVWGLGRIGGSSAIAVSEGVGEFIRFMMCSYRKAGP